MVWTPPMTAVSNSIFTASQFNKHIRDNLLETMPGKVTASGDVCVVNGTNSLDNRQVVSDFIHTGSFETTTSTAYTNLATVGPTVTFEMNNEALVWWSAAMYTPSSTEYAAVSFQISGATDVSPSDDYSINLSGINPGSGDINRFGGAFRLTGMTPGSHTLQLKYRVTGAGAAGFNDRELIVMPL